MENRVAVHIASGPMLRSAGGRHESESLSSSKRNRKAASAERHTMSLQLTGRRNKHLLALSPSRIFKGRPRRMVSLAPYYILPLEAIRAGG